MPTAKREKITPRTTKVQYKTCFNEYTLEACMLVTDKLTSRSHWGPVMKKAIATVMTVSLALLPPGFASAQDNSAAPAAAAADHPDEIVKMHQQVAAANREYNREVAAAKKVYDQKKAAANKKRDAAVAAAHSGTSQ
ncbi:hypothetical protein ACW9YQ_05830 [Paraburkholderia strydomiana]|nr:hypothetical protein [Paraburkholderia strydomiana]